MDNAPFVSNEEIESPDCPKQTHPTDNPVEFHTEFSRSAAGYAREEVGGLKTQD